MKWFIDETGRGHQRRARRWAILDADGFLIIPHVLVEDQARNLVRLHNQDAE